MKLTDIMVSFLLMAAAVFLLLRRSYETDQYYGQFPPMKLTDIMVSFLLMVAAVFPLLRR